MVIQIDTDRCDEPQFGIRKEEGGISLPPSEIVRRVVEKLITTLGQSVWNQYHDRIIFAVAVEMTECWLLPLYGPGKDKGKHLNCLHVLNRCLIRKNLRPINPDSKDQRRYSDLAKPYSKHRELMKHCNENPSLGIFVERLNSRFKVVVPDTTDEPGPSEASSGSQDAGDDQTQPRQLPDETIKTEVIPEAQNGTQEGIE